MPEDHKISKCGKLTQDGSNSSNLSDSILSMRKERLLMFMEELIRRTEMLSSIENIMV